MRRSRLREPVHELYLGTGVFVGILIVCYGTIINFEQEGCSLLEVPVESSTQIVCRSTSPVEVCEWYWRRLNQSLLWNLEVKKFPAFGNDSKDCSIKLTNVMLEQEGIWTCGARDANGTLSLAQPVKLFISNVEFVQLSRTVQIAAGESVLLRCVANKPIAECEWSWRQNNRTSESIVYKKFSPNNDTDSDCSVRLKNVQAKEEGLWSCSVRLIPNSTLHSAPPVTLSLLSLNNLSIVSRPVETSVLEGTNTTLKCETNSRVDRCSWKFKPLNGEEITFAEFPSRGDSKTDCSLDLETTLQNHGFWTCQVTLVSSNLAVSSPSVKLTVYNQEVTFSELSQDIQITPGGSILLRCVTSSSVERCRWSLTPVNTNVTVVVKEFAVAGSEGRDCSVRLSHALREQEGLWTCGAKLAHQQHYVNAPPARLTLLDPTS